MARKQTYASVKNLDLPRRTWSVAEVAAQLQTSYDTAMLMIDDGTLGHIRVGRRKYVPVEELDRFVRDLQYGG